MNAANPEDESAKLHGDKLERTTEENAKHADSPRASALDQLDIPPHGEPQTDGGAKIHGDKLDPHSGQNKS